MDFFKRRHIKNQAVMEDASLGRKTLTHMLEGKDMSLNCYLRLLTAMKRYCADDDEYLDFIMGVLKRAVIEIWLLWGGGTRRMDDGDLEGNGDGKNEIL